MDSIKEIAIAKIAELFSKDLDFNENCRWETIYKKAGQRVHYDEWESYLQPYIYNGPWENKNNRYNPFSALDGLIIKLFTKNNINDLSILLYVLADSINAYAIEKKQDLLQELDNNLNIIGFKIEVPESHSIGKCKLIPLNSGVENRIQDQISLQSWLNNNYSNTCEAYNSAISSYTQGKWGGCVGECRTVITGFFSNFRETKDWFNGVLQITKDNENTNEFKQAGKIFKDSLNGEYTRFKAIYKIYSMLSDLGTHRDECTVESTEQSDALMCLRMTEDILIKFMMDIK